MLRKARQNGIRVLTWDADAEPDARDFFVNQATAEGIADALTDEAARLLDANGDFAVVTGALIGVLGGLVGLILGSLRMPALLRYVGEVPARAVGTNLAVGVCVAAAGVIGHTPEGVDWDLLAIGAAASVPGALLGARLTGRLSERQLLQAIGAVLVVAGCATLAQALA